MPLKCGMEMCGLHATNEAQGTPRSRASWGSAKPRDARAPEIPVCGLAKRGTLAASYQRHLPKIRILRKPKELKIHGRHGPTARPARAWQWVHVHGVVCQKEQDDDFS